MKEEFVNYNQALALKELGFDEPCFGYYTEDKVWLPAPYSYEGTEYPWNSVWSYTTAPLKQQVFRWFREKHKVQSLIQEYMLNTYMYTIDDGIHSDTSVVGFDTYEEAESACIDKLIETVKNK